ncbi:MAG: hypothetical protein ACI9G1_002003 [Pirellulaceae bacterium]|jgi:hypothetical protein
MTDYPDDEDGAVLKELASQGVDMSQPVSFEFFADAPDEAAAKSIAEALENANYKIEIIYDEGEPDENGVIDPDDKEFGPAWAVFAFVTMVPDHAEIIRIQAEIDELSNPFGGCADGWGVMIGE